MKTCITYRRVSTDEQGDSRLGLEAQRIELATFCEIHGITVLADFEEVQSGKGVKDTYKARPELVHALALAAEHRCPIMVSKLDRLSRSVHFISGLMENHVPFYVANLGLNTDPFMLHIYAALAEKERAMIAERTKSALARLKSAGVPLGTHNAAVAGRGAAMRRERADERAAPAISFLREHKAFPLLAGMSLSGVAQILELGGHSPPGGGAWTRMSVHRLLKRMQSNANS